MKTISAFLLGAAFVALCGFAADTKPNLALDNDDRFEEIQTKTLSSWRGNLLVMHMFYDHKTGREFVASDHGGLVEILPAGK